MCSSHALQLSNNNKNECHSNIIVDKLQGTVFINLLRDTLSKRSV